MSPPDEPRAHKGTTEKHPLLGPIVFIPALFILAVALLLFVALFWQ